jgi:hypothetical protein
VSDWPQWVTWAEFHQGLFVAQSHKRHTRRLSDNILTAFHQACGQADFEVAAQLLCVLVMMLTRRPLILDGRRHDMEHLVAAYERLWLLRHPNNEQS